MHIYIYKWRRQSSLQPFVNRKMEVNRILTICYTLQHESVWSSAHMKAEAQASTKRVCFCVRVVSQALQSVKCQTGESRTGEDEAPPTGTQICGDFHQFHLDQRGKQQPWTHEIIPSASDLSWSTTSSACRNSPRNLRHHYQNGQKGKTFRSQRENDKCSTHSCSLPMAFVRFTSCCARNPHTCRMPSGVCVCVCGSWSWDNHVLILTFWPLLSQSSSPDIPATISNGNQRIITVTCCMTALTHTQSHTNIQSHTHINQLNVLRMK